MTPASEKTAEAVCPSPPEILFEPVAVPAICKTASTGADYQACIEGLIGAMEDGASKTAGALRLCNADKQRIKEELERK